MTPAEFTREHDSPLYLRAVAGWRYAALFPLPDPEPYPPRDAWAAAYAAGCEEN